MKTHNNKRTTNLMLDILLFVILLFSFEQHATGITVHEWLGIAITIFLIIHVLLHWKWITCVILNFFREKSKGHRLKFILDLSIFISFSTIIFTGIMMSRSAMPALGIQTTETPFWRWLHFFSVDLTIWLVAVHIALSWSWIVKSIKNLTTSPGFNLNLQHQDIPAPLPAVVPDTRGTKEGAIPSSSWIKNTFKISLKAFVVLIASATISLTWYGLSSTTFAKTLDTQQSHEFFGDNSSTGRGVGVRGLHHRRNRTSDQGDSMMSHRLGLHRQNDDFLIIQALPGMIKNVLIFSLVTAVIVFVSKRKNP